MVTSAGRARMAGRVMPCAVGRNGMTAAKAEGDGATPFGTLRLERVLARRDRGGLLTDLAVPVERIAPWDGWSDDPRDPNYNHAVRRPHGFGHERMWRGDRLYDLVGVLDWNRTPARPGGGSAIFLHIWRGPRQSTEGCVAFRRDDLYWLLRRWRPWSRVIIRR